MKNTHPLEMIGLKDTGAIHLTNRQEEAEMYTCLLTCAVMHTVHLEVAEGLSVETFISCLIDF